LNDPTSNLSLWKLALLVVTLTAVAVVVVAIVDVVVIAVTVNQEVMITRVIFYTKNK